MRLAGALGFLVALRRVAGWEECLIDPEDHWSLASTHSLQMAMHQDYTRRYTCLAPRGSVSAASYTFRSSCMARHFTSPEIRSLLKGRRIIFLGDSMATQQADSLMGMMGWHPGFLRRDNPLSEKWKLNEDGYQVPNLMACYRKPAGAGRCSRCYDMYESAVPISDFRSSLGQQSFKPRPRDGKPSSQHMPFHQQQSSVAAHVRGGHGTRSLEKEEAEEEDTSVHMRMFPQPSGADWLARAMMDYNETRSSDIYVINFGAHYKDDGDDATQFKQDISALLDDMGRLGEKATVVWREIAPTHFPSVNASYDNFNLLPESEQKGAFCTGTPPPLLDRNVWVDNYLKENGLTEKVKVLRIYHMSSFRGSAHKTCHIEQPTAPGRSSTGPQVLVPMWGATDCRHWSETGVVEEWNRLLLNHLFPYAA